MNRKKFERAVGDTTHAAADLGKDALAQAQAYLQQAQDYLAPRAQDAIHQASDYISPYAKDAKKRGAQFAASAVDAARPKLDEALDRVSPALDNAYARIAPAVDDARSKVQYGFLPALSDLLHNAADDIAKVEIPQVPAPKKKNSVWGTLGQVILAGGLLAVVAFAIKKFLAPDDSGWQAHEPSQPYVPTTPQKIVDDLATADADGPVDAADQWLEDGGEVLPGDEPLTDEAPEAAADAEADADPFVPSPYGDGAYVGAEPPEGFSIKGNERSMKYHVQGNGGYERTIADVWFASEEAAEAAGFTKAQR
ncbi:hypothetical protein ET989_03115 [Propioniciclava sinopodophylli]|uniref:Uncharacterized protein n=1 Tax=Propioniciclava sinopodophylli TaxID=1837344 RepID=A0A4Q9KHY1_9ACTN|nr:hypothetical protein ET989_03115 [Propioniciclava sinopodophylli]